MILKEAFHYQNYLSDLYENTLSYLTSTSFITTTKQVHNRAKANPDAGDETVIVPKPGSPEFTPGQLLDFAVELIDEREKLSGAISEAKKKTEFDIDAAMAVNRMKQGFVSVLRSMAAIRPMETDKEGTGYKFNAEGNQVTYHYPLKEIRTIDYDRGNVKKLIKKYQEETGRISIRRDQIDLLTEVDYDPKWDADTPLEDILTGK